MSEFEESASPGSGSSFGGASNFGCEKTNGRRWIYFESEYEQLKWAICVPHAAKWVAIASEEVVYLRLPERAFNLQTDKGIGIMTYQQRG